MSMDIREHVILFLQTQQIGSTSSNPNNTKVIGLEYG